MGSGARYGAGGVEDGDGKLVSAFREFVGMGGKVVEAEVVGSASVSYVSPHCEKRGESRGLVKLVSTDVGLRTSQMRPECGI